MPAALYAVFVGIGAVRADFTWAERDWNGDGRTTIGEFLHSTDVGTRPVNRRGRMCREFFELEDGRPIRVECGP